MTSIALWLTLAVAASEPSQDIPRPAVLDPRLEIELVAAEPDLVTPTGVAVDATGRVLVVESHTHFRPNDYQGPAADRIRSFEDTDGDGRIDRITTFFEGTKYTMNVGIHPDGSVYVATRSEIFRLRDTDGDGQADQRTSIARLDTKGNYPHNGLSGFAFDFEGNIYFGLGENLGAKFKLVGTDGSSASGSEGGQVYRCRADGSKIEMIALGFWNPFHVALDAFGRLFAVDNDPDSSPPCRLLHIVPGGNYGYRYRNGRKGVHPFTAWNGELPGTLPMVSGTGEAPSGLVAYESDHLPADYIGDLLVTSWGDHRIERHRLEPRGASFQSTPQIIVQGDENFRPVGIAVAPDGSVYLSDWVLKSYELHGKGRLWRISAKHPHAVVRPTDPAEGIHSAHRPLREESARRLAADKHHGRSLLANLAQSDSSPRVRAVAVMALASVGDYQPVRKVAESDRDAGVQALAIRSLPAGADVSRFVGPAERPEVRAEALRRLTDPAQQSILWDNVSDLDAFLATAARVGLARSGVVSPKMDLLGLSPQERLAALLVLRESGGPDGSLALPRFLKDPDSAVRFAAIQWVGEERLTQYRKEVEAALRAGPTTSRLFGGYLAALERLQGVVRAPGDEWTLDQYIVRVLNDPTTSPEVLRWSLRMLRPDNESLSMARLEQFIASDDPQLQLEAVRTLRDSKHAKRGSVLSRIARDEKYPLDLRAEAIVGLSPHDADQKETLFALAKSPDRALREEALRSLRGGTYTQPERERIETFASDDASRELVRRILRPETSHKHPEKGDVNGWLQLVDAPDARPGDAASGERIFFHARSAGCSRCHQIVGRGARVGPELTTTAGRLSRTRLLESIVRPSKEIAPHFASWLVTTADGKSLVGMLVDEQADGQQTYADGQGQLHVLAANQVENRKPLTTSIMPDNFAEQLTVQEFRDLLAFLQSLGSATK